jgi:glutathione S-transferase
MAPKNIVLFTYDASVYGRKIEWYLNLRGIKYAKCITAPYLPREQLQELGIRYRRIPWLAIGRDVYCDTRIILEKLEQLIPENRLASTDPFMRGVEYLLESWVNEGGPFWRTSQMIPAALLQDDKFLEDRTEMIGVPFSREGLGAMRPEAVVHSRIFLDAVENRFLADGRQFISGKDKPDLTDIHTAWVWDWMFGMSKIVPDVAVKEGITKDNYPRAFAWTARHRQFCEAVTEKNGKPEILSNEDAYARVLGSNEFEDIKGVDKYDPLGFSQGQMIECWPTDSGQNHHDRGKIVALHLRELVIESEVPAGKGHLHLHFPRGNFRLKAIQDSKI